MNDDDDPLYRSWMIRGSFFNRMLDCGDSNQWVQNALEYLPRDVLDEHKERLVIIAMGNKDGCRLTPSFCKNREIIVLSERVLPKPLMAEDHPHIRYFIFVILHEVAHAIRNHRSPIYDSLTESEANAQEKEADDLAFQWFNEHVMELQNPYLLPITPEEVQIAEVKNQAEMKRIYNGA